MKKNILSILLSLLLITVTLENSSYAASITIQPTIKIVPIGEQKTNKEVNRAEIFSAFAELTQGNIPDSYKYIKLNYKDISVSSDHYDDLQRLVYIGLLENSRKSVYITKKMNSFVFYRFIGDLLEVDINDITGESSQELKNRNTQQSDINRMKEIFNAPEIEPSINDSSNIEYKKEVFFDVYETLLNKHYNKDELDEEKIINKAIQGLASGTEDRHTVYFPPVESKGFTDSLNGEYEGIGAYIDMLEPGKIEIITPIAGSPSEKAGLKGGDIITHVDGKEITDKNSLQEVVSWIKGPAETDVILTISRGGQSKDVTVTRAKIIIKDIEYSKLDLSTGYLQMKSFGDKSSSEFKKALDQIGEDSSVSKIIFDLRNNGGGYLNQVSRMLSFFIEKGESVAVVKYLEDEQIMRSLGYDSIDLNNYTIVILQNSGTASASEILIGTLKDYYPNITIIGEKSYGKGSVQTTKPYRDGSILKYTIARWYTGKTQTGIDGIGITPDREVIFDDERFLENGYDNQLEAAQQFR